MNLIMGVQQGPTMPRINFMEVSLLDLRPKSVEFAGQGRKDLKGLLEMNRLFHC